MANIKPAGGGHGSRAGAGGRLRITLTSILLLLLLLAPAGRATAYEIRHANDEVTGQLTLSPTSVEIDVSPGEVLYRDMTIANRTGATINVEFATEDFEGSPDPGVPAVLLGPAESPQGARTWLQPETNRVTINQGDTLTLSVKITVPENATPGGHYGIFLASFSTPTAGPDGTGVNIVSRVGCYFLLRLPGQVDEQGTLDPPYVNNFLLSGPVKIGLQFNNQGNIHLKPTGTVRIKNLLGMTVAEIPVTPWTVLPNASRYTEVTWDRSWFFGRYSVDAVIDYGSDSKQLISSGSFWAFSWIILLAILAVLVIAALVIFIVASRRRSAENVEEDLAPAAHQEQLIGAIIAELDAAEALIGQDRIDEARTMLLDVRTRAHALGLDDETALIDELLLSL